MPVAGGLNRINVSFSEESIRGIDAYGAGALPGASRQEIIRAIVIDFLSARLDDHEHTATRRLAWKHARAAAYVAVGDALRIAVQQYDALAAEAEGGARQSIVFEEVPR
jgi:hypothetical protein